VSESDDDVFSTTIQPPCTLLKMSRFVRFFGAGELSKAGAAGFSILDQVRRNTAAHLWRRLRGGCVVRGAEGAPSGEPAREPP
jgi:hypothetical protein